MTTLKDFTKPKKKKPEHNKDGILIETEEELKNWENI